jgi:hypothetical protein
MDQRDEQWGKHEQGGRWARVRRVLTEAAATLGILLALGASQVLMPQAMKQPGLVPDVVVDAARRWGTQAARTVKNEVREWMQEREPATRRPPPLRLRVRVRLDGPLPAETRIQLG